METFTLDPRHWRVARVFSTNPLVRRSDRVEALTVMFALVVSLLAVPIAAVVGTTVHEAHRQMYAEQARARHPVAVAAILTPQAAEGKQGTAAATVTGGPVTLPLRSQPTRTADPEQIWVDGSGNRVPAPAPPSRARFDAISAALAVLAAAIVLTAALVTATRWRLGRVRDAEWDRELGSMLDDEGGRTNGTDYGRTS